ncbi:MAG: ATP-binding protein [Campylobacter sp.]|nr:ATP-binding protein [Campylobacter sp.]
MASLGVPFEIEEKIKLWVLRIIDGINKYRIFDENFENINHRYAHEEAIHGLKRAMQTKNINEAFIKAELKKYETKTLKTYKPLNDNLNIVCKRLNLNKTERDILEFCIIADIFDELENFLDTDYIGKVSKMNANHILAKILDLNPNSVKVALMPSSNLMSSYIFEPAENRYFSFKNLFNFADNCFPVKMLGEISDIDELFEFYFQKCKLGELEFSDYDYLKINEQNLKEFVLKNLVGTNILLYGKPGTGKTEFVKMFAKSVGKDLYEIPYGDDDNNSQKGNSRFRKIKFADKILKQSNSLIMFDEIEDVFGGNKISKAMINRTLEENFVPSFWISNDIDCMDRAYIRRFDMAIEFKIPPKSKRFEIIKKYTQNQICEKTAKKLAKIPLIVPALVCSATKVISNLSDENKDKIFKKLIFDNLKAQYGKDFSKKKKKNKNEIKIAKNYDIECVNSMINLKNLSNQLKQINSARICIYGPAGTGKSEFAKFVAKELDKELIIKKGSDLLNAYVGGTEQNIATAFMEAKKKKAVLVFDEVDSFLQSRSLAHNSWEITQVNEMLTQMENFEGIFIATTNLIDTLDEASLRRFDMKLKFDYLNEKQALRLFEKGCNGLNLQVSNSAKMKLANLAYLTPGDFAAVLRAGKFAPILTSDDFADRLESEVSYKKIQKTNTKKIGLV